MTPKPAVFTAPPTPPPPTPAPAPSRKLKLVPPGEEEAPICKKLVEKYGTEPSTPQVAGGKLQCLEASNGVGSLILGRFMGIVKSAVISPLIWVILCYICSYTLPITSLFLRFREFRDSESR